MRTETIVTAYEEGEIIARAGYGTGITVKAGDNSSFLILLSDESAERLAREIMDALYERQQEVKAKEGRKSVPLDSVVLFPDFEEVAHASRVA